MSSIELHIIQNFPPSNLNRDDIGQPKSTDFGGVRRARISSQCQKRAIRLHPAFAKATGVAPSDRTKMIFRELAARLKKADKPEAEVNLIANEFVRVYSSKKGTMDKSNADQTSVLIYMSSEELDSAAAELLKIWDKTLTEIAALSQKKPKKVKTDEDEEGDDASGWSKERVKASPLIKFIKDWVDAAKERTSAPDIALYGRMLADRPETNIDAACQVAHAISTHKVGKADIDYYTAMDDVKQRMKDPGAGFLDVAYFNSACFYRYMRIDFALLEKTLGDHDLAVKTVEGFMRAAEAAIPSGKQNSHAQFTRPSYMLAVLRPDGSDGWNLVNAFEKPICMSDDYKNGLIEKSVEALENRFSNHYEFYGKSAVNAIAVALPDGVITQSHLSKLTADATKSMDDWVRTITNGLNK
jgi:CRISPR system Cascade subunit CasC